MRWRNRPLEGDAETYDGTNAGVIKAFAGDDWRPARPDGCPVVRNTDGTEVTMRPGWTVSRADGSAGVVVSAPGAWAERCEVIP